MESAQQLRRAIPGPMGDDDAISVINSLSAFSFALVAGLFLFGASVARRAGDVFPGPALDG